MPQRAQQAVGDTCSTPKTGTWQPDEDRLLRSWQAKVGNRWSEVAKYIPGRTGQQCAQRWRHKLNPKIVREKWGSEEDEQLVVLVEQLGHKWADIARHFHGRTDQQCMGRWRRHLDPSIKKEAFSTAEDAQLEELYAVHGTAWATIARSMKVRTPQQCRCRWHAIHPNAAKPAAQDGHNSASDSDAPLQKLSAYKPATGRASRLSKPSRTRRQDSSSGTDEEAPLTTARCRPVATAATTTPAATPAAPVSAFAAHAAQQLPIRSRSKRTVPRKGRSALRLAAHVSESNSDSEQAQHSDSSTSGHGASSGAESQRAEGTTLKRSARLRTARPTTRLVESRIMLGHCRSASLGPAHHHHYSQPYVKTEEKEAEEALPVARAISQPQAQRALRPLPPPVTAATAGASLSIAAFDTWQGIVMPLGMPAPPPEQEQGMKPLDLHTLHQPLKRQDSGPQVHGRHRSCGGLLSDRSSHGLRTEGADNDATAGETLLQMASAEKTRRYRLAIRRNSPARGAAGSPHGASGSAFAPQPIPPHHTASRFDSPQAGLTEADTVAGRHGQLLPGSQDAAGLNTPTHRVQRQQYSNAQPQAPSVPHWMQRTMMPPAAPHTPKGQQLVVTSGAQPRPNPAAAANEALAAAAAPGGFLSSLPMLLPMAGGAGGSLQHPFHSVAASHCTLGNVAFASSPGEGPVPWGNIKSPGSSIYSQLMQSPAQAGCATPGSHPGQQHNILTSPPAGNSRDGWLLPRNHQQCGESPADTNGWSEVPALSWGDWHRNHMGHGIITTATAATAGSTPDNTCGAGGSRLAAIVGHGGSTAPPGMHPSGGSISDTPNRQTFLRSLQHAATDPTSSITAAAVTGGGIAISRWAAASRQAKATTLMPAEQLSAEDTSNDQGPEAFRLRNSGGAAGDAVGSAVAARTAMRAARRLDHEDAWNNDHRGFGSIAGNLESALVGDGCGGDSFAPPPTTCAPFSAGCSPGAASCPPHEGHGRSLCSPSKKIKVEDEGGGSHAGTPAKRGGSITQAMFNNGYSLSPLTQGPSLLAQYSPAVPRSIGGGERSHSLPTSQPVDIPITAAGKALCAPTLEMLPSAHSQPRGGSLPTHITSAWPSMTQAAGSMTTITAAPGMTTHQVLHHLQSPHTSTYAHVMSTDTAVGAATAARPNGNTRMGLRPGVHTTLTTSGQPPATMTVASATATGVAAAAGPSSQMPPPSSLMPPPPPPTYISGFMTRFPTTIGAMNSPPRGPPAVGATRLAAVHGMTVGCATPTGAGTATPLAGSSMFSAARASSAPATPSTMFGSFAYPGLPQQRTQAAYHPAVAHTGLAPCAAGALSAAPAQPVQQQAAAPSSFNPGSLGPPPGSKENRFQGMRASNKARGAANGAGPSAAIMMLAAPGPHQAPPAAPNMPQHPLSMRGFDVQPRFVSAGQVRLGSGGDSPGVTEVMGPQSVGQIDMDLELPFL